MAEEPFDPFAFMWTDPKTCRGYFDSLSEEEKSLVSRNAGDFSRAVKGTMDALLGKDAHTPVRIALLMAVNVVTQADMLRQFGFELDEDGAPVEDESKIDDVSLDDPNGGDDSDSSE